MDFFFRKYQRISKLQEEAYGHLLPFDSLTRCQLKVESDFAFVEIKLSGQTADITVLDQRLTSVDELGIIGKTLSIF